MGIGGSIALLVIGAILAFAVRDTTLGGVIDINVVGWIFILAGLVGLVLTVWFWNRRRTVVARPPESRPYGTTPEVVERRYSQTERNY